MTPLIGLIAFTLLAVVVVVVELLLRRLAAPERRLAGWLCLGVVGGLAWVLALVWIIEALHAGR